MSKRENIRNAVTTIIPKVALNIIVRYDKNGKDDASLTEKLTDKQATAIKIMGPTVIYKIKSMKDRSLYSPLLEGSTTDYTLGGKDNTTRDDKFVFREVNQTIFDLYIKFLETKHPTLLLRAERET